METSQQSNMTQLSRYNARKVRPATACVLRRDNETAPFDNLKKFRSDFPNLPGFSKHTSLRPRSPKNQSLNFRNGFMMVNSPLPDSSIKTILSERTLENIPLITLPSSLLSREVSTPNDVSGRYSFFRKKKDRSNNAICIPFCSSSKLPPFLEHDRRVLLFNAYYEEDVLQSSIESKRIHSCEIFFYVEDGTIEIIQTKQENSGIPQGVFLRRSRVNKSKANDNINAQYYQVDDLKVGNTVEIYCRNFHIMSCNESTKRYVIAVHGWHQADVTPLPLPRDCFAEMNKEKMRRESGVPGVDRKRKMHELKEVMESMLGKQTSLTDRGMFLECCQNALFFQAVWDDRERLYGDLRFYKVFYYLADDTIEILPVHAKNDGRDQIPKLLKRSKLPKKTNMSIGDEEIQFYSWKDLSIGEMINVFGRPMQLAQCDLFTRQHYLTKGIILKEDMPLEPEEEKVEFIRQIPPYNGFGSEEDSLRSCTGGINPPPPKKDLSRNRDKLGVILRFNAHLLSDKNLSLKAPRRFVIQYFMEDNTIAIREPPIKNSGVIGGNFLRRQVIKKPDGSQYKAKDMHTGNIVNFLSHKFELLNADEYSYHLMENDERTFPFSNFNLIYDMLTKKTDELGKYFVTEYRGDGKIDMDGLSQCCKSIGLNFNKQQVLTLWRKIDKKGKGRIGFIKIIKMASDDLLNAHVG